MSAPTPTPLLEPGAEVSLLPEHPGSTPLPVPRSPDFFLLRVALRETLLAGFLTALAQTLPAGAPAAASARAALQMTPQPALADTCQAMTRLALVLATALGPCQPPTTLPQPVSVAAAAST